MITQLITVSSTAEERYATDFTEQVLEVLRASGVEADYFGGGTTIGTGDADNDFELRGDEVAIARAKAAVQARFGREVRILEGATTMGNRRETPAEVLDEWIGHFPMPQVMQDAILADPGDERVVLVLARWMAFTHEITLRPQTDPDIIKALRKSAHAAGKLLGVKVQTLSRETAFYIVPTETNPLQEALSDHSIRRIIDEKTDKRTLRLVD